MTATQHPARSLSALDVIFTRRSIRTYTNEKLNESTIRSLLDAAVQAPTAVHEEPCVFAVIQDAAMLKRYSDRAKLDVSHTIDSHPNVHGTESSRGAAFSQRLADPNFCIFYNASTLILICAKPLGPFVVADCWLAAENLMLAACAMGLGTCCIGSALPALSTLDAKAELGIPADVVPIAPIIVGVPRGAPGAPSRKDPEILCWRR